MSDYTDPGQHIFWLASRSLGVIAMVLVAVSVGLGLAMAARLVRGPGVKSRVNQIHEATALVALLAIAGHGLALLGDSYLRPGVAGIAVPFVMSHQPLWTGLGIIGGWLAAALGLSFYARRRIGARLWRRMHRLTILVYLLAIAHTLGSGTDAGTAWLAGILAVTAAPVVVLALVRYGSEPDRRRRRPASRGAGLRGRPLPLPSEPLR